ncbi:hypothetical protein JCM19231_5888 [Vibrio ishigakensis]|uniref:Uncharacterized protein n=1 Tax=Vibrio ishigakensis TaxID=1481914 RepID=A0A0B8NVL3_9VIBR|nr:DUF6693 family protein [Vibrio ishigakensis]GAM57946.1 hypothetical protein JCM19231_5888 [Vibrio ishigakensis]
MKLKADIAVMDILGHMIVWFLLTIITFGIALLFFPYSFAKFVINRTSVVDEYGNERRMTCDIDLFGNIGHVVLWFFITIFTLGIGYFFYFYRVCNYALNNSRVD